MTAGRCAWCGTDPLYVAYHDTEWGVPERDPRALWEKLVLDGMQAGLAWITILRKREGIRDAFDRFDPDAVAAYDESDVERLLADPRIIRSRAKIRMAIDGARISSGFGMRRHPVLGYSKMHKGIDFAAPTGTPILAAGDGVVDKIGRAGAYGNYIRLRHDGKYSTAYAHMSRFARGLKPGSRVRQGQTIGYVGTTGRSTGPHLHYEILTAGKQVNPQGVKFQTGRRLTGKELAAFNARKRKSDSELAEAPVLSAMVAEQKTDDPERD